MHGCLGRDTVIAIGTLHLLGVTVRLPAGNALANTSCMTHAPCMNIEN